jgi:hypothetical protein
VGKKKCLSYQKPEFKLFFRATAIKTPWLRHKTRYDNQRNRTEDVDAIHATIPTWFLIKVPKTYYEEKTGSSTNVAVKTHYLHVEN